MKKYLFLLIGMALLLALTVPAWAAENVTVGTGTLKFSGTLKAGFNYYLGQEQLSGGQAVDRDQDMAFTINTMLLCVSGTMLDNRISHKLMFSFKEEGMTLLDAFLGFHYIPYTGIYVGRIKPNFTHFVNEPSSREIFIDYPLMNTAIFPRTRQTGMEFGLKTTYVDANLGVFNGRQYFPTILPVGAAGYDDPATTDVEEGDGTIGNPGFGDQNTGKDIYFTVLAKPPLEGFNIRAGLWYGTPLDGFDVSTDGEKTEQNASVMMVDAGVIYFAPYGLTFIGELLYANYTWDSQTADGTDRADDTYENTQMSYFVMAGWNFGPMFEVPVELLVRYDSLDPDILDDDEKHPGSETDGLTNITVGVNYYLLKQNAMLSLNYIYHSEEWEDVLNMAGDDTQTGISNDELKLQAQVAF